MPRQPRRPPSSATPRPASPSPASAPRASTSAPRSSTRAPSGRRRSARSPSTSARCCSSSSRTVLTERKDELYALSTRTGATKNDSWVDIDGGIGVLFTYSSKGRRELPNAKVYVDGAVEALSKDGSFLGQHIYTRLPGVAVQINAFNFPVWGSLEKFAPAFLAGMPTLVKPATPIRIPGRGDGAHPRRVGPAARGIAAARLGQRADPVRPPAPRRPGRVHRLGVDRRAAALARLGADRRRACSRARPTRSTRRCSGPMPSPGTPEFDAYVKQLMAEITVKAGQKCTAIRRAIVPTGIGGCRGRRPARPARRARRGRRPARRGRHDGSARLARAAG